MSDQITQKEQVHKFSERMMKVCPMKCRDGAVITSDNFTACVRCGGYGLVDAETGDQLHQAEITRQLLWKLRDEKQKHSRTSLLLKQLRKKLPAENPVYPEGSKHE